MADPCERSETFAQPGDECLFGICAECRDFRKCGETEIPVNRIIYGLLVKDRSSCEGQQSPGPDGGISKIASFGRRYLHIYSNHNPDMIMLFNKEIKK